jgi:hypothetical protein
MTGIALMTQMFSRFAAKADMPKATRLWLRR